MYGRILKILYEKKVNKMPLLGWLLVAVGGAVVLGYITLGVIGCLKFWKSIENEGLDNMCTRRLKRK